MMLNEIAHNPKILNGKTHIRGTRLSVEFILELFNSGATEEELITNYPQLNPATLEEVLKYASLKSQTDWEKLDSMTDAEIDFCDLEEVPPELFAQGVVRQGLKPLSKYLQEVKESKKGHGDYSKDRHKWLDNQDTDIVIKRIQERKRTKKTA